MNKASCNQSKTLRCAIYTRKSSEEGLEQEFNSLDAQREACQAFIKSQHHEGWQYLNTPYDDGGFSGGNMDRPALSKLVEDIKAGQVDIVVVYKIDRLSRSLSDFVRMVELFDQHSVSFVSVTQQFNTSTSMGRLTLNVLLSFAQFEREVTGERIRDKIAASVKKGMWMGGQVPLGYDTKDKKLVINELEAKTIQHIYRRYLVLKNVRALKAELDSDGYVSKLRDTKRGPSGGTSFYRGALYTILKNPIYIGKVKHHITVYPGNHKAIVDGSLWNQVQDQLKANRAQNKRRTHAKAPSLLTGLLYDDQGNVMSPSHGNKSKNRRYRYYVSQATLKFQGNRTGSVERVSAHAIEDLVVQEFIALLQDGPQFLDIFNANPLPINKQSFLLDQAQKIVEEWKRNTPDQKIELLSAALKKVTIGRETVVLVYTRKGLLNILGVDDVTDLGEPDEVIVERDVIFQRCGIESKIIVQGAPSGRAHPRSAQAIQKALHLALQWNADLITGKATSMNEIAQRHGAAQRYVSDLIKLAWLSPDIMKAINQGNIPPSLSLVQLKKGFPLEWCQQQQSLGFSAL